MIIGTTVVNRASYINCRVPEAIKEQFYLMAKAKGKSASTYLLELILKEIEKEQADTQLLNQQSQNL